MYLTLADPDAVTYNPYDLKVVQHSDLKKNQPFLTLSPSGGSRSLNRVEPPAPPLSLGAVSQA